jgi:hypothetical protein
MKTSLIMLMGCFTSLALAEDFKTVNGEDLGLAFLSVIGGIAGRLIWRATRGSF